MLRVSCRRGSERKGLPELDFAIGPQMRVMFIYLGRRGSLGQFTLQLAQAAAKLDGLDAVFTIARSGEIASRMEALGDRLLKLNTYERRPIFSILANFSSARRTLLSALSRNPPKAVVTLMPHIWTPLLAPSIKRLGIYYISVTHDAVPHPGDPTAILTPWLLRDAKHADLVVTLSRAVADRLVSAHRVPVDRILALFHPDLHFGGARAQRWRAPGAPLRLLFFGRIMEYKGLPLLINAVKNLRAEGIDVQLGVVGSGNIERERKDLAALGAEVINRWIETEEIHPLLARYDALALSHVEASQSGVAATAFGRGMPVVGTPVGGIVEQVIDGRTGVLAHRLSIESLAHAIRRLAVDDALYNSICEHLLATAEERSMNRFVRELIGEIKDFPERG